MRLLRAFAAPAAAVALLAGTAHLAPPPGPRAVVLDERRLDYREDADGRTTADIRARLVRRNGLILLQIDVSAVGPFVDPPPGWQGIRGANRITARHLARIAAGRERLDVVTVVPGRTEIAGRVLAPGPAGRLPERRMLADGRLLLAAESTETFPLALTLETGGLPEGTHRTEVRSQGVPRLRATVTIDARGAGRIDDLEGLGAHHHDPDLLRRAP